MQTDGGYLPANTLTGNEAYDMVVGIIVVVIAVIALWFYGLCLWRIVGKTGYNPALSLLGWIPYVGPLVFLPVFAFSRWPIEERLKAAYPLGYTCSCGSHDVRHTCSWTCAQVARTQ